MDDSIAAKIRLISLALVLIVTGTISWRPTNAQTDGQLYFPETGHWVTGEFLKAYQGVRNPLLLYGYPITDAFQDQMTGEIVQYFQRMRFELHSDAPPELRVQLSPLGTYLYTPGTHLPTPENSPACRFFTETGHQVCYAFLDFFNAYGGVAQFGYPISDFELQDERMVQYFQRARFEWHPEYPAGQRVTLTDLGTRYFYDHGEDPIRLLPNRGDNVPATILDLQVRAFSQYAVTPKRGTQTVYVIVQDQNLRPVPEAQVEISVATPSGEQESLPLQLTDEHGIAPFTFSFVSQSLGLAQIKVTASYEDLKGDTVTAFRIWW